ncbi:hypothetical protein F4808DRAFT_444272 [Astrocystis sublimbata]|nr:hypothetical protein F4808DRAFT_444272 [Astrocystis sublimbata]
MILLILFVSSQTLELISLNQFTAEMDPPSFTFVTEVGTAGMSKTAAKQMRSHITKTNFAKRRARLAKTKKDTKHKIARQPNPNNDDYKIITEVSGNGSGSPSPEPLSRQTNADGYDRVFAYLSMQWSHIFLDGTHYPSSANEADWVSLLISEPALVESSMAVGLRHWSPRNDCQQIANEYSSKATETIIRRIGSGRATTDAMIAAVLTMAFGERLLSNDVAWNIHIDGAVQLVKERASRGTAALPPWVEDMLIKDVINDVFGFPRFYHKKLVDAAHSSKVSQYPSLVRIAGLCETLSRWLKDIGQSQTQPQSSDFIMERIVKPMHEVLSQARALRSGGTLILQASCIVIELIIYLAWGSPSVIDLTAVAGELKETICAVQFRPCCCSDLTCCHLMIGAMAAGEGSPTRTWFMDRLRIAWSGVKSRACSDAIGVLESNMTLCTSLGAQFQSLWVELDSQS